MDIVEIYDMKERPVSTEDGKKYFVNIGGEKNYQCILADKKMSRGEFMFEYGEYLDKALQPVYEDEDIVIRQDAKIAMPGFYIVTTMKQYSKISEMPYNIYLKCQKYSNKVLSILREHIDTEDKIYVYYEEHYLKPMAAHLWVFPIYKKYVENMGVDPTIDKKDIWKYFDSFKFVDNKEKIYEFNEMIRKELNK